MRSVPPPTEKTFVGCPAGKPPAIYLRTDHSWSKTPTEALALTREYAEDWLPSAEEFLDDFRSNLAKGRLKKAAFELHQAAERFYHGLLLTLTLYTPHSHRLSLLRSMAEQHDSRPMAVWPRETRLDRAHFEKLKDAYIKARYSKHYRISEDELKWLGTQVEELGRVTRTICCERIEKLDIAIAVRID